MATTFIRVRGVQAQLDTWSSIDHQAIEEFSARVTVCDYARRRAFEGHAVATRCACFGATPEGARDRVVSELAARGFRGTFAICLTAREGSESVRFERVEIG